ncbi:MAG: N-acetyltransferase [Campylobacterota bacterium]|nr:N-acetyltransferase [Campylobacterota bacterium]
MMSIVYSKPTVVEIQQMQDMVKADVENGNILLRTADEMATNIRSYIIAKQDDVLVGFCALHIYSPRLAEIRSLIVSTDHRKKGIGSSLVKECLVEGKKYNIKEVLALTYHKELFEHLDFKQIQKESIPEHKIWADCIRCKHFPICDEISLSIQL